MGNFKNRVILEEEAAEKRNDANPPDPDVLDGGGDEMLQDQTCDSSNPVNVPSTTIVGGVTTQKIRHDRLVLDGVCSRCAHCALRLTDSVSIQRGLGPICSKKGYDEDPVSSDEVQALIDLADYPELVEFLMKEYKPQGVRGLMNGLVRVASLNRKTEVHAVCCQAIDSLGYHKLASLLRESLAAIEIKSDEDYPGYVNVWVKRDFYKYQWSRGLAEIHGVRKNPSKTRHGMLVPLNEGKAWTNVDEVQVSNRQILQELLLRHYEGYTVKTPTGAFKITAKAKIEF